MSTRLHVPAEAAARIRVPATSANLGPAFDAAGLSLALHDDVSVRVCAAGCSVEVTGEGSDTVPHDESHLVLRAARAGLDHVGLRQPGLALRAVNRIPHGRGLGSSAAATVAGLLAARCLARAAGREDALSDTQVLALATDFEGHADNVGAALHGGLTLVWGTSAGRVEAARLQVHPHVAPLVLVPRETLSTARARGLLPESVPHRIAAHNVGRSALLVMALTQRPDLLLAATEDRLHQPYRSGAFPGSMALVERLRAQGHAAVISGAGPSVLVLATASSIGTVDAGDSWRRLSPGVDDSGAVALESVAPR